MQSVHVLLVAILHLLMMDWIQSDVSPINNNGHVTAADQNLLAVPHQTFLSDYDTTVWISMSASRNVSGNYQLLKVDSIAADRCIKAYSANDPTQINFSYKYLCNDEGITTIQI